MTKLIITNYDSPSHPVYGGGGAKAVHQVARRLAYKYEVTVVCGAYPGCRDGTYNGVFYRYLGNQKLGPYLGQIFYQVCLPWYLRSQKFDLVLETFSPPFTAAFLPFFISRPVIALVHGLPAEDLSRKYHLPGIPYLFQFLALRWYRNFIVMSPQTAQTVHSINSQAVVRIIPNGVNLPPHYPPTRPRHLLFVGRLDYTQKGLDLLLTTYSHLNTRLPLVIAGFGQPSDTRRIKKMIESFNLTQRIRLVGRISGSTLTRLYRQSACVLVTSRFETFSLVSLEAIAHSVPVVCFDIPGLRWLSQTVCLKTPPFDALRFATRVNYLLTHPHLRSQMVRAARQFAAKYSWSHAANSYSSFINSLL